MYSTEKLVYHVTLLRRKGQNNGFFFAKCIIMYFALPKCLRAKKLV